ncbi:MAG TPA: SPFH domain-containing protein, partial [Clostridia bacterium]|nr:SPFH domain-containing protein [Clostridia bacterium]
MGLIRAITGAVGGVLSDQWREYFYCESMDVDVLVRKGQKRTGKRSSNTKGEENIISNGSIVAVNEGQFMMIVDNGKVVEFSGEPGEFVYDSSTTPSMLYGG